MNLLSLSLRAGPEESQAGKGLSEAMIRWLSVCGWLDFRISEPVSELSPTAFLSLKTEQSTSGPPATGEASIDFFPG